MDEQGEQLFAAIAAAAAERQFGLVTRKQLVDAGMNERRVDRLLSRSRLNVVLPQIFAFPGSYRARSRAFAAAVLWYGNADRRPKQAAGDGAQARSSVPKEGSPVVPPDGASGSGSEVFEKTAPPALVLGEPSRRVALSHLSAAEVWELQAVPHDPTIHVIREGRKCEKPHDSIEPHGTESLMPDDIVTRADGLRVTSALRTVFDLAASITDHELELAILDAVARQLFTVAELEERYERERKRKTPGIAALEFVMQRAGFDVVTESPLEREVLQVLLDAGLKPEGQHKLLRVPGDLFIGRYDLVFRREKVLIEVDSKKWHRAWKNKVRDGEKTDGAVALGYEVVRVRKRDLFDPGKRAFLRRVRDALTTATVRAAMNWPKSRLKRVTRPDPKLRAAA